jgi:hypothetical protein
MAEKVGWLLALCVLLPALLEYYALAAAGAVLLALTWWLVRVRN